MRATANPLPLSGVVIAFNEADRIRRCVASLVPLCSEVLVLDSGSTDATAAIASEAGARVVQQPWLGFAAQKNTAIAMATQPWVLLLDADEWLDERAPGAIRLLFETGKIDTADVWRLHLRTHFLGTVLAHGGRGSEPVDRLFRADMRYRDALVHEALALSGKRIGTVRARIEHDTARSEAHYASKLDRYAALWAQQRHAEGRRASALSAPLHALANWLKNYVFRGGFLDGGQAWRFHQLHARYVHQKYRLLRASRTA